MPNFLFLGVYLECEGAAATKDVLHHRVDGITDGDDREDAKFWRNPPGGGQHGLEKIPQLPHKPCVILDLWKWW